MSALLMAFINDASQYADHRSSVQLFYDPVSTVKTRRSIDGTDDIDHLLQQLMNEVGMGGITLLISLEYM